MSIGRGTLSALLFRAGVIAAAVVAALARKEGTLIEVMLDPQVITTRGTLSGITANALKK